MDILLICSAYCVDAGRRYGFKNHQVVDAIGGARDRSGHNNTPRYNPRGATTPGAKLRLVAMPVVVDVIVVVMDIAMAGMPVVMDVIVVVTMPVLMAGNEVIAVPVMSRVPVMMNGNGMSRAPAVPNDAMAGVPIVAVNGVSGMPVVAHGDDVSGMLIMLHRAGRAVVVPAESGAVVNTCGQVLLSARRGRCRARQERNARRCESGTGKRNPLKRSRHNFLVCPLWFRGGFSAVRFTTARLGG